MFSNCHAVCSACASRCRPIRDRTSGGWLRYQSDLLSSSRPQSSHRGSVASIASAGSSQSMSTYASKCFSTERWLRRRTIVSNRSEVVLDTAASSRPAALSSWSAVEDIRNPSRYIPAGLPAGILTGNFPRVKSGASAQLEKAFRDRERLRPEPLTQAFSLRVEAGGGGHALPEHPLD